jgi:hypothetical protein
MYPYLERWFFIPRPARQPDRRPESELQCLTPTLAAELKMRTVHELASDLAAGKLKSVRDDLQKMTAGNRRQWLKKQWALKLGDIEPYAAPDVNGRNRGRTRSWKHSRCRSNPAFWFLSFCFTHRLLKPGEPLSSWQSRSVAKRVFSTTAPLKPIAARRRHRGLSPDLRGMGETSPDTRRDRSGKEISLAATELMLDNALLGARLDKDRITMGRFVRFRQYLADDAR